MDKYILETINDVRKVATKIIEEINKNELMIIVVNGEMGAGKTTMIKEICTQLKVVDAINSPTFSIINEYQTNVGETIYHFDCYRISSLKEALEIGIPEYLESGNNCFIEWHENIASLLPNRYMKINIDVLKNHERIISLYIEESTLEY